MFLKEVKKKNTHNGKWCEQLQCWKSGIQNILMELEV